MHRRVGVSFILLLVLAGCAESEAEREERAMEAAIPHRLQPDGTIRLEAPDRVTLGLEVATATEGELPDSVLRTGRLLARPGEDALVVAPVTGRLTQASPVSLGDTVEKGAALVRIAPILGALDAIQSAQLGAEAETARTEVETRIAEAVRDRDLAKSGIVSVQQLQQAEAALSAAKARLEGLERAVAVRSSGEGEAVTLRAPVAGTLVSLELSLGRVVQAGDVVARIVRPGPRWVDVRVPPAERAGSEYEVLAGDDSVPARLVARGGVVEKDGVRHDRIEIDAAASAGLIPGQVVSVRVALGAGRGIVLPAEAVVPGPAGDAVFVEVTPGVFASRAVEVAARLGGRVRLSSGIQAGEQVVTRGAMSLRGETLRSQLKHTE